jgi:hypothetical protein
MSDLTTTPRPPVARRPRRHDPGRRDRLIDAALTVIAERGVATLVPAAMHTADELPGLPPGTGLTIVSQLLRGGSCGERTPR